MSARLYKLPGKGATVLLTRCEVCGGAAPFGEGVSLLAGKLGLWFCREHRPAAAEKSTQAPGALL